MRYRPALLVVAVLAACAGHVCMLCLLPMMDAAPADDAGPSLQRVQQWISRDMESCLSVFGQESNAAALHCACAAQEKCLAAGLPKGCAWDDWALESHTGHYPVIVGLCEDR